MPVDPDVVEHRIRDIRSSISELINLASKPFEELGIRDRLSIRYLIIVLVEALVSLAVHIAVEAYDEKPESYKEAIRKIADRLEIKCRKDLEALISLRNLLIHRYWTIDDERIYKSIKGDFKCVEELLRRVEEEFVK